MRDKFMRNCPEKSNAISALFAPAALLLAAWFSVVASSASAADPSDPAASAKWFEQRVQPILEAKCQRCHGTESRKSDLNLNCRRLERFGISRQACSRGLSALERAGLVSVERKVGRCPRVTIIENGGKK